MYTVCMPGSEEPNNLPTQVCCKDKLMARGGRITGVLGFLGLLSRQNMT